MSERELKGKITMVDETGPATQSATKNIEGLSKQTSTLTTEQAKAAGSTKDLVVGLSGVATSAFSLYMGYERLATAQLTVSKAMTAAKAATNTAEDAQKRYNAAVEKFGAASPEATAALADLQVAQERAANAEERATLVQKDLSNSYTGFALSILPSAITMVASMDKVMVGLGSSTSFTSGIATVARGVWAVMTGQMTLSAAATGVMTVAQGALNAIMAINPIFLVVMALAALTAALVWAYQNCEPFRNAVNWIGTQLLSFFKPAIDAVSWAINNLGSVWEAVLGGMRWIWDHTIGPIVGALGAVWSTLTGASSAITGGAGPAAAEEANVGTFAHGFEGVVSRPTAMLVGEAGPEYISITPMAQARAGMPGSTININSPLVYIQGSADEKTARLAADRIMQQLRNY